MFKKHVSRWILPLLGLGILALFYTCGKGGKQAGVQVGGEDVNKVIEERGLTPNDVLAAVKTYLPTGKYDEYLLFSSGGHSGQVLVIGVPSMRLLKVIGVFTPEPWQGWGYSTDTWKVFEEGGINGTTLTWGDTHHPALSETNGDYDGEYLFINDKANARVAVIDLRDFETKQIIKNPLTLSDHGGAMVTPNTEWVIEGGQYGMPWTGEYAPLSQYKEKYKGMITFWKFDRKKGRLIKNESFAMELPPYWQDLSDPGKLVSEGWVFLNSFNTEMATGGVEEGNPPFEAGVSQRDMDYMHVINLKKAAQLFKQGKTKKIRGFNVLTLDTAIKEGILYFIPEPKSPHGVDVSPDGRYIVVSGKLDPHVTIYNFDKIQQAIAEKKFSGKDEFGVPVLDFDAVVETQIEVGLGPLHTQFDPNGFAYTSLFLESAVARWTMGGEWASKHGKEPWSLVDKVSVHYNIGHLVTAEGDNVNPDGKYLVALNKWAIDRYTNVGPLLPQNFQLVDIESGDRPMQLLYDMPIGIGEPHYAQMIKADKIKSWEVYPEIGWNPHTQSKDPDGVQAGQEKVVRRGRTVEIWMSAIRSHYTPERVEVRKGDRVIWHITNIERAKDATHGFALPEYNFNLSIEPGETQTIEFVAKRPGVYPFYCTEFCSALHLEMMGYFLVKP